MSDFKPIADGLDAELLEHKSVMDGLIKELNLLEASDKSNDEKLEELGKISEKINKVRLEIDKIKNIIRLLSPDAHLN
jgi:hypothetical protein